MIWFKANIIAVRYLPTNERRYFRQSILCETVLGHLHTAAFTTRYSTQRRDCSN